MSAPARTVPLDPLAGVATALATFRSQAGQATRPLRSLSRHVQHAASALGGVRTGADPASAGLRQVKSRAESAGQSLTRTGRAAGSAGSTLRTGTGKAHGAVSALAPLTSGSTRLSGLAGTLGSGAGTVSRFMGPLAMGLTVAGGAMTAVNVAMRANPLGFVLGLVVPLAAYLIELALGSETGRKTMKKVFDQTLVAFRAIWSFLSPVVSAYAKIISTVFTAVRTLTTSTLKTLGSALSTGLNGARGAVSAATNPVTGLIRSVWNGFKPAIRPVTDWITTSVPAMFRRVKDAMSRALTGMGGFVSSGAQSLLSVIKGPLSALIAFANWIIDGLNGLSFSLLGKKFGVDLPKIPQLAEGGVVLPAARGPHAAVLPLSALDRLRPAEPGHRPPADRPPRRATAISAYHEPHGRSALFVAEDLRFLQRTA
ncbi:phage tail tape measure protein [Streptomyces corynorhini]|uniref:Tape-measure protein n=1 Tax=Streptomyces corynorhini TaxID=2282652 RepID=A0A370BFK6_9ACTN|nr:tape-measure protein [Streptomyces corynorhini]RDG38476.1 tape-measure protein [Streptomyces corynorhini]